MTLTIRKIVVLSLIGAVLLIGNIIFVANWLADKGVVDWAKNIRAEYLTGTAITIIVVLLILLVRRCPVCDHVLLTKGVYCSECGSRV
jgi:uncharacterized membrane protein